MLQKAICIACIYINVEMKYDTVQKDSLIENKETVRIIELGKDNKEMPQIVIHFNEYIANKFSLL